MKNTNLIHNQKGSAYVIALMIAAGTVIVGLGTYAVINDQFKQLGANKGKSNIEVLYAATIAKAKIVFGKYYCLANKGKTTQDKKYINVFDPNFVSQYSELKLDTFGNLILSTLDKSIIYLDTPSGKIAFVDEIRDKIKIGHPISQGGKETAKVLFDKVVACRHIPKPGSVCPEPQRTISSDNAAVAFISDDNKKDFNRQCQTAPAPSPTASPPVCVTALRKAGMPESSSCRDILTQDPTTRNKDGFYNVKSKYTGLPICVYCDMSRDGGGWELAENIVTGGNSGSSYGGFGVRQEFGIPQDPSSASILESNFLSYVPQRAETILRTEGQNFSFDLKGKTPDDLPYSLGDNESLLFEYQITNPLQNANIISSLTFKTNKAGGSYVKLFEENTVPRCYSPYSNTSSYIDGFSYLDVFSWRQQPTIGQTAKCGLLWIIQQELANGFTSVNTMDISVATQIVIGSFYRRFYGQSPFDPKSLNNLSSGKSAKKLQIYFRELPPDPSVNGGRISAQAGVAVPSNEIYDAQTIYFVPYTSNKIALHSGPGNSIDPMFWELKTFSEMSVSLAGTVANRTYPVYAFYQKGASPELSIVLGSPFATNIMGSGEGQDFSGVSVAPGDVRKKLIGIIRTTSAGYTQDTKKARLIGNVNNRVSRSLEKSMTIWSWQVIGRVPNGSNWGPAAGPYLDPWAQDYVDSKVSFVVCGDSNVNFFVQDYAYNQLNVQYMQSVGVDNPHAFDSQQYTTGGGMYNSQGIWTSTYRELAWKPGSHDLWLTEGCTNAVSSRTTARQIGGGQITGGTGTVDN
ncbi:MAG: hypothetical protein HY072_07695 [Deltaproteobacteria bacterium]|nr:hypothetical protein [Deltaproteobacteria bacterium]